MKLNSMLVAVAKGDKAMAKKVISRARGWQRDGSTNNWRATLNYACTTRVAKRDVAKVQRMLRAAAK